MSRLFVQLVNAILGEHNVDKQISDSRGDVGYPPLKLVYRT